MNSLITHKSRFVLPALLLLLFLCVNSYGQFAGGSGTDADPWLISTPHHLNNIRDYLGAVNSDKYFKQINDIDLGVDPWNTGSGWEPIGSNNVLSFRGNYNGDYYTISNLTITREETNNVGLFGFTNDATIENLILQDVSVVGQNSVGAVIGYQSAGTIRFSSSTGTVTGRDNVGGLIGIVINNGHINTCFSRVNITGRLRVGGLTGSNFSGSVVRNCFATGNITGASGSIGGLIGRAQASLTVNSYSTGSVTTPSPYLGGLVGSENQATVTDSYWNRETSGLDNSSGGEGRTTEQMTYPYSDNTYRNWDFAAVWKSDTDYHSNDGYPYHLWTMSDVPAFLAAEAADNLVRLTWREPITSIPDSYNIYRDGELLNNVEDTAYNDEQVINYYRHYYYVTAVYGDEESDRSNTVFATPHPSPPYMGAGTEEAPYIVESAGQLAFMRNFPQAHFQQEGDIDLGVPPWNSGKGWLPIGYYVDYESSENVIFTGSYNGGGYAVTNLTINNRDSEYQGLFGYVQEAELSDINLRNVRIQGQRYVGGIAGYARDTIIDRCSVQGEIWSVSDYSGGLAGYSIGIGNYIRNSYSNVNIHGASYIGGLIGYSTTTTFSITDCYASGSVIGTANCIGGLVGYSWGEIRNSFATSFVATTDTVYIGGLVGRSDFGEAVFSYWDIQSSGQIISAGGTGLNTLQMLSRQSFLNYDFDEIWTIREGETYPYFIWQEEYEAHNIPGPYSLSAIPGSAIVRLNWEAPAAGEAVTYKVFRNDILLDSVDAPSTRYIDTTVLNYNQYTYYVAAVLAEERYTAPSNRVRVIPFTFAGGDGSLNDPYLVESAHQLHAVKSQLNSHFRQIADIDLGTPEWTSGSGWQPIGTTAVNSFNGSYDGGGYRIFNMTINDPGTDYQGLFGFVRTGKVRNLGVIDAKVTGRDYVGGLAGRISDGSVVENSYYYGDVTGTGIDIGGLVGTNIHSRISNCYSYGSVRANSHNVGGLVGWNEHSIIENSFSMSDVEVTPLTDFLSYDIGGLVGFNINNSLIRNCRAGGNVTAVLARRVGGLVGDNSLTEGELGSIISNSKATGNVIGDSWVGGLVGRNYSTPAATRLSEISESYSTGSVFSYSHNTGGLVGRNDNAVINRSFSKSTVSVENSNAPYNQGGLVGRNTIGGIINDCYATGRVIGYARVGGLVGDNFRDTGETVYITNSYATGRLTRVGQLPIGGLTARNLGGEVTDSYWDGNTTERTTSAAGEGRTTEQMTYPHDENTYSEWDFERIWIEDTFGNRNNGYPYLRWQKFVTNLSIRGDREVFIPFSGMNRYEYDFRIYCQEDYSMNGTTVIWQIDDDEGYENVANGYITINELGFLSVCQDASEGSFTITAISEEDEDVTARLNVSVSHTEISSNPKTAVNPYPQHRAEEVALTLSELIWSYQEDNAFKNPVGFRIYFGESEAFGDSFEWVDFIEGEEDYYTNISVKLNPLTTYYWMVVPTTQNPEDTNRYNRRRRASAEDRHSLLSVRNGDAENCPVWSFTTTDIDVSVEEKPLPLVTGLHRNYPNPFNPETIISFSLAEPSKVVIEVFNSRGQRVKSLMNEYKVAGKHTVVWNGTDNEGRNAASGVYFLRMRSDNYTGHNKMLLLK